MCVFCACGGGEEGGGGKVLCVGGEVLETKLFFRRGEGVRVSS